MREFDALLGHYRKAERIKDVRAALAPWVLCSIYSENPPTLKEWMDCYMPWASERPAKQTPEEMQQMFIALNALLGGEVTCSATP
ncbi:MAG: hypothetical protein M0R06_16315 [Sphaerochaeta sp.]|jgi:hypothetical protein|nr:hypothetical protein [Sphaerochaeta sp.]